jgi:hypothetical protein
MMRVSYMSDDLDWDFANSGDAKADIRAAVEYLLRNTSGAARADIVLELIQIVRNAVNGVPAGNSLDEGMPGG